MKDLYDYMNKDNFKKAKVDKDKKTINDNIKKLKSKLKKGENVHELLGDKEWIKEWTKVTNQKTPKTVATENTQKQAAAMEKLAASLKDADEKDSDNDGGP